LRPPIFATFAWVKEELVRPTLFTLLTNITPRAECRVRV
jgi:hypothetical protein